jgi:hypothetical protein
MAEIIEFPKMKLDAPPQSAEELSERLTEYRTSFSNDVSEQLWNLVLIEMVRSGCRFEQNTEEYYPSIILLLEAIKSLHLQASGIHHPLQDFAKDFIVEEDLDEEMVDIDELLE